MVFEANPELLEQSADGAHDEVRTAINQIISRALGSWCELIKRAWVTGVCGEEAERWGIQLELGHAAPGLRQSR
jgi:hypothetical protein